MFFLSMCPLPHLFYNTHLQCELECVSVCVQLKLAAQICWTSPVKQSAFLWRLMVYNTAISDKSSDCADVMHYSRY